MKIILHDGEPLKELFDEQLTTKNPQPITISDIFVNRRHFPEDGSVRYEVTVRDAYSESDAGCYKCTKMFVCGHWHAFKRTLSNALGGKSGSDFDTAARLLGKTCTEKDQDL